MSRAGAHADGGGTVGGVSQVPSAGNERPPSAPDARASTTPLDDASARAPRPWYAVIGSVFATAVTQVESLMLGSVDLIAGWLGFGAPVEPAPNIREVSDRALSPTPSRGPVASKP